LLICEGEQSLHLENIKLKLDVERYKAKIAKLEKRSPIEAVANPTELFTSVSTNPPLDISTLQVFTEVYDPVECDTVREINYCSSFVGKEIKNMSEIFAIENTAAQYLNEHHYDWLETSFIATSDEKNACVMKHLNHHYCIPRALNEGAFCDPSSLNEVGKYLDSVFGEIKDLSAAPSIEQNIRLGFIIFIDTDVNLLQNLLETLNKPQHTFILHADSKLSEQDFHNVIQICQSIPNCVTMNERLDVSPHDITLLFAELLAIRQLLETAIWDYVINLSIHDFPIKDIERISTTLLEASLNKTAHFLQSKLVGVHSLVSYTNCGLFGVSSNDTIVVPEFATEIFQTSPWFVLTRAFSRYLLENEQSKLLAKVLAAVYEPHKYFFGTLTANSKFNDSLDKRDWRYEGWGRNNKKLWEKDIPSFFRMEQLFVRKIYSVEMQNAIIRAIKENYQ
jgi:hypothetical protein